MAVGQHVSQPLPVVGEMTGLILDPNCIIAVSCYLLLICHMRDINSMRVGGFVQSIKSFSFVLLSILLSFGFMDYCFSTPL